MLSFSAWMRGPALTTITSTNEIKASDSSAMNKAFSRKRMDMAEHSEKPDGGRSRE